MDFMTIFGFLIGGGCVYYVMYRGGIVYLLFNFDAFLLVFGGTIGCAFITYPWKVIHGALKAFWLIFLPQKKNSAVNTIKMMVHLAEAAKVKGIQALMQELPDKRDTFMVGGIQMLADDLEPDIIRDNLEKDITFIRRRHQQIGNVFRTMGTYAPIFGLLGTLIGVVQVLKNLTDPSSMGKSMAIAITTTFYGIFLTNFIFLPIAGKLASHTDDELLLKEVVIEGLLAIQKGDIPMIVSKKLETFLSEQVRSREIKKKKG